MRALARSDRELDAACVAGPGASRSDTEPEAIRRCSLGVMTRCLIACIGAVILLLAPPAALAKEFEPGDLRICNARRCVPVMNRPALTALGVFYYIGTKPPPRAPRAHVGAPSFELRFDNGYVTGIVATADRFLSYGVNLGRFDRGRWYRVPPKAARELQRLTASLRPIPLTRASLARSR
jgi:hypothetical protein